MTTKEKFQWIDQHLKVTSDLIKLTMKNRAEVVGYFEYFDDELELAKDYKMRFVRNIEDSIPLRKEKERTGRLNPMYSVVVAIDDIVKINDYSWEEIAVANRV